MNENIETTTTAGPEGSEIVGDVLYVTGCETGVLAHDDGTPIILGGTRIVALNFYGVRAGEDGPASIDDDEQRSGEVAFNGTVFGAMLADVFRTLANPVICDEAFVLDAMKQYSRNIVHEGDPGNRVENMAYRFLRATTAASAVHAVFTDSCKHEDEPEPGDTGDQDEQADQIHRENQAGHDASEEAQA